MENVTARDYATVNKEAGYNISWRAIIAGLVTFVASMLLFSLIGNAIGFGVSDITSNHPLDGVGTGLLVWLVLSLLVSLGLGGFIAGVTANRAGFVHGFLTWAMSVIALFFLGAQLVSGVASIAGQALGAVGNSVASVAQSAGTSVAGLTQDAFDQVSANLNLDTNNLQASVREGLQNTEIPELQPEFLQSKIDATVQDIKDASYAIVVEGKDPQQVATTLKNNVEARINDVTKDLNRDDLVKAVSANTELTPAEVDKTVDNIEKAYSEAAKQADQLMNQAVEGINQLTAQAEQAVQQGREVAEDVTNSVAKVSMWTFAGLLIGLFVTAYAGHYGSKYTSPFV